MKQNPVQIVSVDAKDLYLANIAGKDYTVKYKDGGVNFKKYINTLDDSLDLRKLREVYYKVCRKNDFGFVNKNRKSWQVEREYCNQVVNVTFGYSCKQYNKVGKNTFVKIGFLHRDLVIEDCICIVDGEVVAIEIGRPVEHDRLSEVKCNQFKFNVETGVYEQDCGFRTVKSVKQLRQHLYENGFTIDGIKYVRFKRSSGSARVGKCLFINEKLLGKFRKWDMCGLRVKEGQDIDLAAFEAAISLSLSSIIDTVEIEPENILVIDDYDSVFEDDVVAVTLEKRGLVAKPKKASVSNSIWDGQALLDVSVFGEKYKSRGMLLLRNQFFKTCAFSTNLQKWFSDNGVTEVSQLKGFTLAKEISQIKMVTTPNSIKYLKFGSINDWLQNIDKDFGVVKYDKPTRNFNGRMVQIHYQLLNTLQLSYDDVLELMTPSLDYISQVRNDPVVLRHHIRYPYLELGDTDYHSMNDVVFGLLGLNEEFSKTKQYQDFRNALVKSLTKNLRRGHVLVRGTNATMFGNGLEMLKAAIGQFNGESDIGIGNVYSKMFGDDEEILGTRSPHINSGNVYLATNKWLAEFDKYFNLSREIICVNTIGENLSQRTNGCDFDSDAILLTNNQLLIKRAKQNYNKFLVPTSLVEDEKTKRQYTTAHQTDLDVKTSVNKIGEIVNLSQELNSLLWHNIGTNTHEESMALYYDICKLAVLSGIEIDRAKKEFLVDSHREIDAIKTAYRLKNDKGKIIKPMFFKMIVRDNGYKPGDNIDYSYRNTPMDYVQKIVRKYCVRKRQDADEQPMPLSSIVRTIGENKVYGKHKANKDSIVEELKAWSKEIRNIFSSNGWPEEKKAQYSRVKSLRDEFVINLKLGKRVAFLLLKTLDDNNHKDIRTQVFQILFNHQNAALLELLNDNCRSIDYLEEDVNGDVFLHGFAFSKVEL